ncbi:MAG: hypothetical protein QW448_02025 [Thermofilaceae archaeon]
MIELTVEEILGRRVVIVGERGAGKTRLTARLLEQLASRLGPENITVIDMAPTTVPGAARLSAYTSIVRRLRYLAPPTVRAPRLEGRTASEVLRLAEANRVVIEPLLDTFLSDPTPALVVNDLTIYLHAGSLEKLLSCISSAQTFLANAYRGVTLADDKGSGVTERERKLLEEVLRRVDMVVALRPLGNEPG